MFEIRLNKILSTKGYLDPGDGGKRKKFSKIKSNKLSLAMGCVRVKLTYEGRTFRRTVDPRSFTWAQFLAWGLVCFPSLAEPASLHLTYDDEDGDHPSLRGEEDWREALCACERLDRPLRVTMTREEGGE
ncbi:hypothetical protein NGA_0682500, partial [Nannochloropsis gaditana CCMP526]